ncbi:MAG TPA: hypothetical protein VFV05_09090 [Methylomirabilota bacterium]|nr:hypothetical protein [Methylomirabilota bacterium]
MSDIRRQIGVDYLRGKKTSRAAPKPESDVARPPLDSALLAHGRAVLEAIRKAEPEPGRLYAIVEELQLPIDVVLRVVDYLEREGYVAVAARDLKGNHALRLTAAGAALIR